MVSNLCVCLCFCENALVACMYNMHTHMYFAYARVNLSSIMWLCSACLCVNGHFVLCVLHLCVCVFGIVLSVVCERWMCSVCECAVCVCVLLNVHCVWLCVCHSYESQCILKGLINYNGSHYADNCELKYRWQRLEENPLLLGLFSTF